MAHAHDKAGYIAATELAWEKDRNRARIRGESIYHSTTVDRVDVSSASRSRQTFARTRDERTKSAPSV